MEELGYVASVHKHTELVLDFSFNSKPLKRLWLCVSCDRVRSNFWVSPMRASSSNIRCSLSVYLALQQRLHCSSPCGTTRKCGQVLQPSRSQVIVRREEVVVAWENSPVQTLPTYLSRLRSDEIITSRTLDILASSNGACCSPKHVCKSQRGWHINNTEDDTISHMCYWAIRTIAFSDHTNYMHFTFHFCLIGPFFQTYFR